MPADIEIATAVKDIKIHQTKKAPKFEYVIENDMKFLDMDKFLGSSYLLERLGFDEKQAVKLLADAYIETKIIREAIMDETGRRFLEEGVNSDRQQMQQLMDNALSAKEELQLGVGVALSNEQVEQLNKNIMWLVEEEVDGQKVLAPKIYLTKLTRDNIDPMSGAIISGDDVSLIARNGSIDNTDGYIVARNGVALKAKKDIDNTAGTIKGDDYVSLTTEEGDIINETRKYQFVDEDNGYVDTWLGEKATIQTDGTLIANAGRDFNNTASDVIAGGAATIIAGRDVNFETIELNTRRENGTKGENYDLYEKSENIGSNLQFGGTLGMKAGRDINVVGSDVNAEGESTVIAGGNFNVIGVQDTEHIVSERSSKKAGTLSTTSKYQKDETYTVKTKGSNVNLGKGDSYIQAKDMNIVGSSAKFKENAQVNVDNVNIVAMKDVEYESHIKEESTDFDAGFVKFNLSEKENEYVHNQEKVVKSDFTTKGDAVINVKNDMCIFFF